MLLKSPLRIKAGDPLPDWRFEVVEPINGPAITIVGDRQPNGIGAFIDKIQLECNWLSAGIVFEWIDNAVVEPVKVHRSNGTAVSVQSCRQSLFRSIQVTEAVEASSAVEVTCFRETQGDSTNACRFDFVSVYACNASRLLTVRGNQVRGLGTSRNLQFGLVFLHPTWEKQLDKLPQAERQRYFAEDITQIMLFMSNVEDVGFDRLKITAGYQSMAYMIGPWVDRVTMVGQALVYDANQVNQKAGADTSKLAVVVRR